MAKLKAAILTDVHYGLDIKDKLGSKAPRLMEKFKKAVLNDPPDLIIDMGDRVSDIDPDTDLEMLKRYHSHFNDIAIPYHSIMGNHDIKNLTREMNSFILGTPAESYSIDQGGYHLVFWSPKTRVCPDNGIDVHEDCIKWLRDDLAKTDKPAILFSHVPVDNLEGEGTRQIDKYFYWTQGPQIREILEDAGNVVLAMAGHWHRDRYREINGIHYITQNSLVGLYRKNYRIARGTFAYLEADDDNIRVRMLGKSERTYELKPLTATPKV